MSNNQSNNPPSVSSNFSTSSLLPPGLKFSASRLRQMKAIPRPVLDPSVYPTLTWETLPSNLANEQLFAILKANSSMLSILRRSDPELADAVSNHDVPTPFKIAYMKRRMNNALPEATRLAAVAEAEKRIRINPNDEDAKKILADDSDRRTIRMNEELAMEYMPESFARVSMLYIPATVNDVHIKAFVDSGAQSTIMSKRCAERTNLIKLVDTKYAGTAVGVGSAKILGRIHMADLRIGGRVFPCSITVMDQGGVDFLFGLDMLRRYRCSIDLSKNCLVLRLDSVEVNVPFLGEADMPKDEIGSDEYSTSPRNVESSSTTSASANGSPSVVVADRDSSPSEIKYEHNLKVLSDMGYDRARALRALEMSEGSLDTALALIEDL